MITSEAGILHQWNKDIYFILGDQKNNEWFVKVLINPFVSFIWLGVIIMVFRFNSSYKKMNKFNNFNTISFSFFNMYLFNYIFIKW